jgi:hypothetical protein
VRFVVDDGGGSIMSLQNLNGMACLRHICSSLLRHVIDQHRSALYDRTKFLIERNNLSIDNLFHENEINEKLIINIHC